MKTSSLVALSLLLTAALAPARAAGANQSSLPAPTAYREVERGANHKVWQRETYEQGPDGKIVTRVHKYTELASGLHYQNSQGEWLEAKEEIETAPGGAVARQGQHQVIFANNLNSYAAIDLQTPDGKRLRSNVLGLGYTDKATGESVLIAQIHDSQGELISDNQVLYPDAFEGVKADVRYTYKKGSFEQDVILLEQPPAPEAYGLNSETTELEVITEFLNPPVATVQERRAKKTALANEDGQGDQEVSWGTMRLGRGRAFDLSEPEAPARSVSVQRRYEKVNGRNILLEIVPVKNVQDSLQKLPLQSSSKPKLPALAAKSLPLPATPLAATEPKPIRLAAIDRLSQGYVLDYILVASGLSNLTFQGDSTYLISGAVNVYGILTLEGGTVIKYDTRPANGSLQVWGNVNCATDSYRPAVFTSFNDNSVGENLSVAGSPTYYNSVFSIDPSGADINLHDLRFSYTYWGLHPYGSTFKMSNVQFTHCNNAFYPEHCNCVIDNVLMCDVDVPFGGMYYNVTGYNVTIDGRSNKLSTKLSWSSACYISFVNSLLVNVGVDGDAIISTNYTARLTGTASQIFQTVGGGCYYLPTNSLYRNAGTTNLSATILENLAKKTTYAPVAYTNITFTAAQTFSPQAQRDTDTPDLGYHYDPLDYAFGGCTAISNLTFAAGTAVGWFRTTSGSTHAGHGIHLADLQTCAFNGTVTAPCSWVRLNNVQEQDLTAGNGPGGLSGWASTVAAAPCVKAQFLRSAGMAGLDTAFRDDNGALIGRFTSCEFYNTGVGSYLSSYYVTNCLFDRASLGLWSGLAGNEIQVRNCTFHGGSAYFAQTLASVPTTVLNSAFDGTSFNITNYGANAGYATYNNNAYSGTTNPFPFGVTNVAMSSGFNWQKGRLGNYYLPTNSILINKGSTTADQVSLYHFTTQTHQVKETNSQVDIGYHYVATDAYGNPMDTDGDGIPDYIEDANGNGVVDVGELNWSLYITLPPADQSVVLGANATFTVAAAGILPLYYQWYFNASPIAGATSASLTLNNVQTNSAGNYFVIVTNIFGSATSSPAILNVITKPVISVSPISKTALVADTVQLSATAVGVAPLAYQWQWNGVNLSGATNATLTLPAVQLSQSGSYRVVVSNSYGTTYSLLAALRVWQPGVVQMVASSGFSYLVSPGVFYEDSTKTITNLVNVVAVTSGGQNGTNLALRADGTVVAWSVNTGITNTILCANLIDTGLSNVVAIAEGGYGSSSGQPNYYALKSDGTVMWTRSDGGVDSSGWILLDYQNVTAISANGSQFAPLYNDGSADAYVYVDDYTNEHVSITNAMAFVCSGDAYLVLKDDGTLQAFGGSPDWYHTVTDVYGETAIPAQLTNTPGAVIGIAAGENHFIALKSDHTVVAWGDNASGQCDVPSGLTNVWSLATGLGRDTDSGVVDAMHYLADSLALKSDGTLIKWMVYFGDSHHILGSNYVALAGNAAMVGESSADGSIPFYDWAIYGAPQITEQPSSQTVCSASLFTLSVGVATGSPVRSYQWRKNGVNLTDGGNISGATNAMLSFASFAASDVGNYSVVLANEGGAVTSAPAMLSITTCTPPVITQQPQSQLLGVGTTAIFNVTASGPSPLNYQWRKDGNNLFNGGNVSGANSPTLTIQSLLVTDRGNYDVVVSNPAGAAVSSSASLGVFQFGVDTDGDGLPDTIDADINNPDTTPPVFVITAPTEWATY